MRISVAMATHNGERYLRGQLESIERQSRRPDEVVISDDCSSDSTLAVAEAFARRAPFDVTVIRNDETVGYGENFFRATEQCSGHLIAFSDQDDVWHVDKLLRCEVPFLADPGMALAGHSTPIVDQNLRPTGKIEPRVRRSRAYRSGSLPPFAMFPGRSLMVRSTYLKLAPRDSLPGDHQGAVSRPISHEQLANLVCGALGNVVYLTDRLSVWRRHGSNVTGGPSGNTTLAQAQQTLAESQEERLYARLSQAATERHGYLERLRPAAAELGSHAIAGLERALRSHQRYADAMERRASVYARRSRRRRGLHVAINALRRDYSSRNRGGLGVASLTRDIAVGVVYGPRDASGSGNP